MKNSRIKIGVTGTGSLIGQGIIKCINTSKLKSRAIITGFDYIPNSVGSYWCDSNHLLPDVFKNNAPESEWLGVLIAIVIKEELQLLFIGIDFELPLFAKYKDKIEAETGCIVIVNNEEVIRIANDKYLTAEFLKVNDLNYPESYTADQYHEGVLEFPLIIKPRVGARSIGVNVVKSQVDFDSIIATVNEPVIQECIGTMENEYTCGVIYIEGEMRASIALSRSLKDGNTFTADFRKNTSELIYDYLGKVTHALRPFCVVNYQLRIDDFQQPKIFEINARHSGTTFMRSLFGYNEVEYIISYFINEPLPDMTNLKEGRAVRYFEEFLVR